MGIFDKKKSISRYELGKTFRRDKGHIKGGEGKYSRTEREKLHKDIFGPRYGSQIDKFEYKRAIRGLERERSKTKDIKQREVIDDKIKYLEQMGGRGF